MCPSWGWTLPPPNAKCALISSQVALGGLAFCDRRFAASCVLDREVVGTLSTDPDTYCSKEGKP